MPPDSTPAADVPPSREVHCGDGRAWLEAAALGPADAVVTSLPDVSELPDPDLDAWRSWFVDTAALACRATHDESVIVFYQTDIKRDGCWVDKGFLVQLAADQSGLSCLFHKIVCRVSPGTTTFGRPAYAHLLAFSRTLRFDVARSMPDVLPETGHLPWSRAMGVEVCAFVCRFLARATSARRVIDPFCGLGTMLAVANAHGLDAVGVELSKKRARRARRLTLPGGAPDAPVDEGALA